MASLLRHLHISRTQLAHSLPWLMIAPALPGLLWSASGFVAGVDARSIAILIAAGIVAELLKVTIYEARQQTLSFSLMVGMIMAAVTTEPVLGPPAGLLAALIHVIAIRQRSPAKIAFNLANLTVAANVATGVYVILRPAESGFELRHLLAALVAVSAFYVLNVAPVAAMISLHSGRPFRTVARESAWFGPTNILLGLTGAFLGGIHALLGLLGAVMFLVPVLVMRFTLSFYAKRSQQTIKTLEAQAERLDFQARHDALTGLANRAELHARVAERIHSAESEPFALLLIDLDRFKEINDTFGHHHGDLLLQEIGPRLAGALTSADLIARLGGDEFGILLHHANTGAALASARALLHALNRVFVVEGHQLHVDASIGVVVAPDQGSDPDTLLRRADVAMYVAKSGHLGAALYAPEADEYSPDKLTLVGDLRQALEERQLVLHFQPKVNLATGCADSAEALVRWQHPRRGMIRPDLFIGLAEHTGLIKPLTQYVLDAALRELSVWLAQGWDLSLAVNASVQDLYDVTFPAVIARLLDEHRVPARHLRVEITEGAAMADIARTEMVLARIKDLGVGVSLDDFGTGYSSLAYLKRLPIDELKVDRSFVRNLASDVEDAAIVRSTIALGHELGMTVTAEGAEDMAAVRVLSEYHCDRIQGYVFSKPLPAAEFIAWLTAQQPHHTTALAA